MPFLHPSCSFHLFIYFIVCTTNPLLLISRGCISSSFFVPLIFLTRRLLENSPPIDSNVRRSTPSARNSDTVSLERNLPFSGASEVTIVVQSMSFSSERKL